MLERWITPSLFQGLEARDETELCQELGQKKKAKLLKHRQTFITEADFKWLADQKLKTVRVPVPYWIFGGIEPYEGGIEFLDFAIAAAQKNKLNVVIDLHTAPGSQNGWDHSGKAGEIGWHKNPANIDQTLNVIEGLAERYKDSSSLIGIELLNEPSSNIPHKLLLDFYIKGYELVRKHCHENIGVIISDAYRPYDWSGAFDDGYQNVILDIHLYQMFSEYDKRLDMHGHVQKALNEWRDLLNKLQRDMPVIVGEWCLGLPPKALSNVDDYDKVMQAYAAAQLQTFSVARGWFFWTYKTEDMAGWSLRESINRDWLNQHTWANG